MPLFNKYELLKDADLKRDIEELADSLKFPLKKLYVVDGSKRSSHSNAFLYGFGGNKRIGMRKGIIEVSLCTEGSHTVRCHPPVLFDTLLTQVGHDEIVAILGHELGHWKLGHMMMNIVVTQVYSFVALYFFSLCYTSENLYKAFGFDDADRPIPTIIALMLFFQTLWAPVDKVLSFLLTANTRRCEFAADKFACDLGKSKKLQSALCKIYLENLGAMSPDPWYSLYHYSHPPLVERLTALLKLEKAKQA